MTSKSHRRRRRQRYLAAGLLAVATLAIVAGIFAVIGFFDLRATRADLLNARATLEGVAQDPGVTATAEGRGSALQRLRAGDELLDRAGKRANRSLPLFIAGLIPGLHQQRTALLRLIGDASDAANAGASLVARLDRIAEDLRLRDGTIPLAAIGEAETALREAGQRLALVTRPPGRVLAPLRDARRLLDHVVSDASERLLRAADAARVGRSLLGVNGDRRYFVAVQNNAEMRDSGMVLSYATVRVTSGHLTFDRTGHISDLLLTSPASTAVPPGTAQVFGPIAPTQAWQSVNATADFNWSAQAMTDMALKATGSSFDGVVAMDVPALVNLLRAVGGISVPGLAQPVTAENAAQLFLHDQYEGLGPRDDQSKRLETQAATTRVLFERITRSDQDVVTMGRALADATRGGHFRVWSANPEEQRELEELGVGDTLTTALADRTFHVAVENRTATKLDYYVHISVRHRVTLTRYGGANVDTFVKIENTAPVGAQPSYALGPDEFTKRPGEYTAWVLVWGPAGATQPLSVAESGLNLSSQILAVGPGETKEALFLTAIPNVVRNGRIDLRLVPQSRATPIPYEVRLDGARGKAVGRTVVRGTLDRDRVIGWRLRR